MASIGISIGQKKPAEAGSGCLFYKASPTPGLAIRLVQLPGRDVRT